MKKKAITGKEIGIICVLIILLAAILWYMLFYKPMQSTLTDIATQSSEVDNQISIDSAKLASMNAMQEELDAILASDNVSEIAAYDNSQNVMNQLDGILRASTLDYSLNFYDPVINDDGTVRREVSMNFSCGCYADAKQLVIALTESPWRCIVNSVSITANSGTEAGSKQQVEAAEAAAEAAVAETADASAETSGSELPDNADIMLNTVNVSATITYFESTKLS